MDCATSCEAVKFTFTKPSEQLFSKFKTLQAEVWTYILILGSIPISMSFAHGLNRSKIAESMIWNKTAAYFGMSEYAGGFAFLYALLFTAFFAILGLYLAAKVLKKEYASTFETLGYAYAPLFILGSLGHALGGFFTHDYQEIVGGFAQAFGFVAEVAPLAKRGDAWLAYFELFKWLGVLWALILLAKRLKLVEASRMRKALAYFFASFLILFFIGTNIYRGYILKTYGMQERSSHAMKEGREHTRKPSHAMAPLSVTTLDASKTFYFSLTNPMQKSFSRMGMHGMGEKKEIPTQNAWLLTGGHRGKNILLPQGVKSFYLDTTGVMHELHADTTPKASSNYSFEVPANGYYNLFAIQELEQDGQHITKVAKLEYLRGSHGSEDQYSDAIKKEMHTSETKIDLIRVKTSEEDGFFHRHAMGDLLEFQAFFEGKPLADATLKVAFESGWSKMMRTDAEGKVSFHIIRDYFPEWSEFDKRHKEEMLLTLSYMPSEKEKYILTYPLFFYPNVSDYQSYSYALTLITLTLLLSGFIIYRFRRNRTKTFSELRYEE
jgi:hypothetical protein